MATGGWSVRCMELGRFRLPLRCGNCGVGAGVSRHPDSKEHGGYYEQSYDAAQGHFSNRVHDCSSPLVFPVDDHWSRARDPT